MFIRSRHAILAMTGFSIVVVLQSLDLFVDPDVKPVPELTLDMVTMILMALGVGLAAYFASWLLQIVQAQRAAPAHRKIAPELDPLDLTELTAAEYSRWELSGAEREIATEMLRGLSHKEIARVRNANVATVRQQSQAVYRKSGLSNRAVFCAHFLSLALDRSVAKVGEGGDD